MILTAYKIVKTMDHTKFLTTILLVYLAFLTLPVAQAQVSYGGEPLSFSQEFKNSINSRQSISVEHVSPPDLSDVIDTDAVGKAVKVNFSLTNSGTWLELENGDRIWQLEIRSSHAKSLAILYEDFYLPEGATLFAYSCDKSYVLGSYNSKNNSYHRRFLTGDVPGECVIIEYFEPKKSKGLGTFKIYELMYLFNKKKDNIVGQTDFGDSESCNININCTSASDWSDEKQGVIKITKYINGLWFN